MNDGAEVITRVASGDSSALAALYDRFGVAVFALAHRIVGDRADAEDVTQEVFAQAWRNAKRSDAARATPAGWLLMMARSRALDRIRARGSALRAATTAVDDIDSFSAVDQDDAETQAIASERDALVRAAVAELPAPQRTVLELAFYRGLTHPEIASFVDAPLGTVKTRVRAALMTLRNALQPATAETGKE